MFYEINQVLDVPNKPPDCGGVDMAPIMNII